MYTTPGDVERIARHTGLSEAEFAEFRQPKDPSYLEHPDDPVWLEFVFRPDGTRRILQWQAGGDCVFLGSQGCTLPTEVRPLYCRLYPLDYNQQGLKPGLVSGCPVELLREDETLLAAIGMSQEAARRWHRQLYEELLTESQ